MPCETCPTCLRAIAINTNGTFYRHNDRNKTGRPVCEWSGRRPEGHPIAEPRRTPREQLAAAIARAEKAEAERDQARVELTQLRAELHDEWGLRLSTHQPGDAKPYGRGDIGRWEAHAAQQQWHEVVRREVTDWRDAADDVTTRGVER